MQQLAVGGSASDDDSCCRSCGQTVSDLDQFACLIGQQLGDQSPNHELNYVQLNPYLVNCGSLVSDGGG